MYAGYRGDMIMTSFFYSLMFLALTMFLFSYVSLSSPRVVCAPACGSDGMQMTSFSQEQSFTASGSFLSGMDTWASEEVISGKTDESVEPGLSLPQESHALLNDLLLLESMERENQADEEAVGMAVAELSSLSTQEIFDSVRDLKGEELLRALRGIELLGRYEAVNTKWDLSLSGRGAAFLLCYVSELLPRNVSRCFDAVYMSMLHPGDRNGEAVKHLFGMGDHRLPDSKQELSEKGLSLNTDSPNKKGAGRPSFTDTFREKMTPCVLAAGIPASDLDALIKEIADSKALELSALAAPATPEEESSSGTEDSPESSTSTAPVTPEEDPSSGTEDRPESSTSAAPVTPEEDPSSGTEDGSEPAAVQEQKDDAGEDTLIAMEDCPGPEELQAALDNLRRQAAAIEEAVKPFTEYPKYSPGSKVQKFFAFCWEVLDSIGPGLEHQISFGQSIEGNDDCDFIDIINELNKQYLFIINTQLKKLQDVFQTLGEALEKQELEKQELEKQGLDQNIEYRVVKTVSKIITASRVMKDVHTPPEYDTVIRLAEQKHRMLKEASTAYTSKESGVCFQEAMDALDAVISHLSEDPDGLIPSQQEKFQRTRTDLAAYRQFFDEQVRMALACDSRNVNVALCVLAETFLKQLQRVLTYWDMQGTPHQALIRACDSMQSRSFKNRADRVRQDFLNAGIACGLFPKEAGEELKARELPGNIEELCPGDEQSETAKKNTMVPKPKTKEEVYAEVTEHMEAAHSVIEALLNNLQAGMEAKSAKGRKSKGNLTAIPEAISCLQGISAALTDRQKELSAGSPLPQWQDAGRAASDITGCLRKQLDSWERDGEYYHISYSKAREVGCAILRPRYKKRLQEALQKRNPLHTTEDATKAVNSLILMEDHDEVGGWLKEGASITPEERQDLILQFFYRKKDPTDPATWIEYIVTKDNDRTYGAPDTGNLYCSFTGKQLQKIFTCLTGVSLSIPCLRNILTKTMGYTRRQSEKLDQIGPKHPERHLQHQYIQDQIDNLNYNTTLLLYIDVKAVVPLGNFKRDNGRSWCSGKAYSSLDHDFYKTLRFFYPFGTDLFDSSRLDELALLYPHGVLCHNDNTGYVSLTIGKSTAESMRVLIEKVIQEKRKSMPELTNVILVADGGGANRSDGVLWLKEINGMANRTGLTISVLHYAPGCSRHNRIEHALWGRISLYWKSKPFLSIEHVARYIREAGGEKLKITCWFDGKYYMSASEKKDAGEKSEARKMIEKRLGDHILHPFPPGTARYRWNYTVYPGICFID